MLAVTVQQALECCSSQSFASALAARSPFRDEEELIAVSRAVWWRETPAAGWLEAFAAHPKIGDLEGLRKKYGAFAAMSLGEQAAAAATVDEQTLQELADWNARFERKFGHIFIICAAGKSAQEMLEAIKSRYDNTPAAELCAAACEQQKITEARLLRVVGGGAPPGPAATAAAGRRAGQILTHVLGRAGHVAGAAAGAASPAALLRSPITTHVLDTSLGRPAEGVRVVLHRLAPGSTDGWERVAVSATNLDGRVPDLLPPSDSVSPGGYKITFDMSEYMARCKAAHPAFFPDRPFYPSVTVHFQITPEQTRQHFHVPLTWNPYGYSTYRGS